MCRNSYFSKPHFIRFSFHDVQIRMAQQYIRNLDMVWLFYLVPVNRGRLYRVGDDGAQRGNIDDAC